MLEHIAKFIAENNLLAENDTVIVGVSGGADSVALLEVLNRLNYKCIVCHCNFHLRAEESLRDELFVHELAMTYRLPYIKIDFDTKQYAKEHALSVEMAARELRYNWFEEQRRKHRAAAIAVGHHQDDLVETVLLNLVRGTGIRGLTGIRPRNRHIVRPLLSCSKKDILEYLESQNLTFVTDSTNEETVYMRNFIRNKIVPLFVEMNPSFSHSIQKTTDYLNETEKFYFHDIQFWINKTVSEQPDKTLISISGLEQSPAPATLLFEILSPYGFNATTVKDIAGQGTTDASGKIFYNSNLTFRLVKDRENFILTENTGLSAGKVYIVEENTLKILEPVSMIFEIKANNDSFVLQKNRDTAYFDYSKVRFPLYIRRWKDGDWFIPFGMEGRKKISDYFSDNKFSLPDKENTWLVCSADDDILWIVGHRADNRYRITKNTQKIFQITCK